MLILYVIVEVLSFLPGADVDGSVSGAGSGASSSSGSGSASDAVEYSDGACVDMSDLTAGPVVFRYDPLLMLPSATFMTHEQVRSS